MNIHHSPAPLVPIGSKDLGLLFQLDAVVTASAEFLAPLSQM